MDCWLFSYTNFFSNLAHVWPGDLIKYSLILKWLDCREKPAKPQTISTSQIALWLERLTPDQEDVSSDPQRAG
jgi:hypothetical protein